MILKFAKINIQSFFAYRARILIWAFTDIINFVVFPFIWLAIFGNRSTILGYSRADIVTYYIILAFISLVCSSHISEKMKQDILKGELNNYLVKPINYLLVKTVYEASYKILTLIVGLVLFTGCLLFFPRYLVVLHSVARISLFIISLIISFIISQLIQFLVGLSSFWLGENSGPDRLRHLSEKIFAGEIAPLSFLPTFLQITAAYLPFQYLAYFPAQIYLNHITILDALRQFLFAFIWITILFILGLYMWRKGVRQYEGVGI